MTNIIKQNLLGLAFLLAIDNTYLYLNKDFYKPIIDKNEHFNITSALLSWIVIIIGINLLVLSRPELNKNNVFIFGAYLGFVSYALWNFTNYALYPSKWNIKITIGDTLWGTFVTGTTAFMMYNFFS
jgi:uncharacterized membrane protein